ncbi:MAG: hypothetical protein CMB95_06845 [Flavobacteriaceae bacterium]|nr:hypothetical protein [Flavobacteriaceae bacterium]
MSGINSSADIFDCDKGGWSWILDAVVSVTGNGAAVQHCLVSGAELAQRYQLGMGETVHIHKPGEPLPESY